MKSLQMKRLYLPLLITVFSFSFLVSSCGFIVKSKARKRITEESGAIPPDLGKDNTTMIFLLYHGSYNRYMKKNVKRRYIGDYVFLDKNTYRTDETYQDIEKYRYVFGFDYLYYTRVSESMDFDDNFERQSRVKKFFIHDRKLDSVYRPTITSGLWSKLQKVYLDKLSEKIRFNRQ
jgi:hypothetical protein